MPNIASILKEEIMRLARKEVRAETESLKKASATYRSEIAALKRRLAVLEKQAGASPKKTKKEGEDQVSVEGTASYRFSAKRLVGLRKRLGLSAADFGALIGVTQQTIYNWESEKARPRTQQLAAIAGLRAMGKRQIKARLQEMAKQDQAEA